MGRTDPDPRRQQMLSLLEETGTLNVGDLADRFGVSLVTVRKDLDELGAEGLLERTFGGAVFSHRSRFNRSFLQRALEHRQKVIHTSARNAPKRACLKLFSCSRGCLLTRLRYEHVDDMLNLPDGSLLTSCAQSENALR